MPGTLAPRNPKLDAVFDVVIDTGSFKYILCKVKDVNKPEDSKCIVRGMASAQFHSDIYDELDIQLDQHGLACECLGGGKITHDPEQQHIEIYGRSQGYGKANHSLTAEILKTKYPEYRTIVWSDD